MEPTRNAWAPVAAWFKRRGAKVVLVPTTQSADLRDYYSKHTKNDRLDSVVLARLPLLHPEGLRAHVGQGPGDPLRRATRQRSSIMKRRTAIFARIDALLELAGPGWYEELGTDYGTASLHLLARYGDPRALLRLGRSRLAQVLIRHSHGQWRHDKADHLLAVARGAVDLWDGEGIDLAELGEDLAVEAEQALMLTAQIRTLDTRIARLYTTLDPQRIARTAPGVGPVLGAAITARLGDPHRFTSLAAIRSYSGLVPKVLQSGQSEHHGGITKAGAPLLRQSLWMAADMARRRPPAGLDLRAADERRPPPRHRDLPRRHHPAHPPRRLFAHRAGLRHPRRRRQPDHRGRRQSHHQDPTPGRPRHPEEERPRPQPPTPQAQDEPGVTGVAKRSNNPARQDPP